MTSCWAPAAAAPLPVAQDGDRDRSPGVPPGNSPDQRPPRNNEPRFHDGQQDPNDPGPRPGGPPGGPRNERPSRGRGSSIDWELLKKYDPEMYELERKDQEYERRGFQLAQQLRRADPELRDKIREDLRTVIADHFDVRQQRRRLQLKRLEEELAKARESIEKRDQSRDELINKRLSELSGERDPLDF